MPVNQNHSTESGYFGIILLLESFSHGITKFGQVWSTWAVRLFVVVVFLCVFFGGAPCCPSRVYDNASCILALLFAFMK